jgi:chaperonin cofactor prefoldin
MTKTVLTLVLCASIASPAELPVTQVVLYKHGVGFFERSGKLSAGQSARLDFAESEMNDVLKSLTLEEPGGGKISGLRYDSQDTLTHRLSIFPFQIGAAEPLSGLLDRLKGARLELKFGADTLSGIVVNARNLPGPGDREQLTLLLDSGELRNVDLSAAASIRFADPQLQLQFRDYLTAVAAARSKDKRSVYIDSTDAKERDLRATYMVPSPVWKSSYRLIFGNTPQPTLEGWAIVDNTTGQDWTNVRLSLVSGRPISFVSQLYAPRYVDRPGAELSDDHAARPVVHSAAMDLRDAKQGERRAMQAQSAGGQQFLAEANKAVSGFLAPPASPSSIVADAIAQELGELFEYRIAQPVTIRRNQSAMLPFLQQPVEARKLLIYSDHSSTHPTDAAELVNNSGKALDGGPITIYDGGVYGGEALMETLKTGDRRLISYAVDLGTRITEAFGSKQAVVREIHLNRGILTTRVAAEETRTYTVKNVDQKAKSLIIEHPIRPEYALLNREATRKTPQAYRFEIQLAAGATQEFPVQEERVYSESTQLSNLTPDVLVTYIANRSLTPPQRAELQQISDQKRQVAENASALQDAARQIQEATTDESRIRQNIGSLNNVTGQQQLVQTYARQLDAAEQRLAALRDRQAELEKRKSALEATLNHLMETLSF